MIQEIQPQLAGINGTVAIRKSLVEKTLIYLEALWKDSAGNRALTRELIESYVALASVASDAAMANTGDRQLGSGILTKAEHLADALSNEPSLDADSLATLAKFYQAAARNGAYYGPANSARPYAQRSVTAAERLARIAPGERRSMEILAASLVSMANFESGSRSRIPLFERALAIYETLEQRAPSDVNRKNTALANKNLAGVWDDLNDYQRSPRLRRNRALALDEKLLEGNPASPEDRMAVAFDLGEVGWALYRLHNFAGAASKMRENVAIREKVADRNPEDRRVRERLAYSLRDLAEVELAMDDRAAAQRDFRRTIGLYEALAALGPLVPQSLNRYAMSNDALGELEWKAGRIDRACPLFLKAASLLDEYRRRDPSGEANADEAALRAHAARCAAGEPTSGK